MQQIQKLNSMGVPIKTSNTTPMQVVNVTYGHQDSGKLYSYYGKGKRTGDIITPKVTHPQSGKVYKTLAVVKSTHELGKGKDTFGYLHDKDIPIKPIGKTEQTKLPGYYPGWDKDAKAAYELKQDILSNTEMPKMQKLSLLREIKNLRK